MRFRIKSGWFSPALVVEADGVSTSIECERDGLAQRERHYFTWTDGHIWALTSRYGSIPYTITRDKIVIAEGSLRDGSVVEWSLYNGAPSATVWFESTWSRLKRMDRAYGSRGNVIMEARYSWCLIDVAVSDAWCDLVPIFALFCISSAPMPG